MKIQENISLKEKTTLKIGGPARYFAEPQKKEEILELFRWAKEQALPVFILGNGSNVVISDSGFSGLVISLTENFSSISWQGSTATCQGGALLPVLVAQAIERGLGGIEKLGGIPGTVGGAAVMNAGANGQETGALIESVSCIDFCDCTVKTFLRHELQFAYRTSSLQKKNICLAEIVVRLTAGNRDDLKAAHRQCVAQRRKKLPWEYPNCGSVFKNPPGQSAGAMIDACGLKGYECGGVKVSAKHANVIINFNKGTAADFKKLVMHIQKNVFNKFKIMLETEVIFV
jgi:UDP-N-acetylmuramate dehydrogenase